MYVKSNWCDFIIALCGLLCVVIFGACAKDPQLYRLPMPQYNYFGAGFALMIICVLSAGFCVSFLIGAISESNDSKENNSKYRQWYMKTV